MNLLFTDLDLTNKFWKSNSGNLKEIGSWKRVDYGTQTEFWRLESQSL